MITKIKQFFNDNTADSAINKLLLALTDLKLIVNDTKFISQLQISNRLKQFFANDQTKILFLNQLLQVVGDHLQQQEKFYVKLKMLLLVHIIISSQIYSTIARADLSKMIINTKLNINIKANDGSDDMIGLLCQSYYCYIYKLASQTTLINEDVGKPQDDLMIYFTLSNQCYYQIISNYLYGIQILHNQQFKSNLLYIGMNMQRLIETINNEQVPNDIIAHLVKFLYFDIQDIYIFILKDVKYLIEKNPSLIINKQQLLELYKEVNSNIVRQINYDLFFEIQNIDIEVKYSIIITFSINYIPTESTIIKKQCQSLQTRMVIFYKFNRIFPHFSQIMPPHSIQIKNAVLNSVLEEKHTQAFPKSNQNEIREPLSAKNADRKIQDFTRPLSPKEKY